MAVQAADASVQRTPTLLKILKEAGVVNSGGYGLLIILSGMQRYLDGQRIEGVGGDSEISGQSHEYGHEYRFTH